MAEAVTKQIKQIKQNGFTSIDLFSGCGGFSLGLKWAGFHELAAIDFNPEAVAVFKENFPEISEHVLEKDLQEYEPAQLAELIGTKTIDLIVGGPPCQGFSTIRQSDGANSGERIIHDERRELYQEFLKFVKYFKPKIFVIENVLGIRSAAGGHFFNRVQLEARQLGYRVHGEVIKAWEFGVPQKRERQLIVGTQLELPLFSSRLYMQSTHSKDESEDKQKIVSLGEAIGDLPLIKAGKGNEISTYNLELRKKHLKKYSGRYILDVLEANKTPELTSHKARPHSERDLRDFKRLREGETSAHAIARGIKMEFPYNRETFKDRYTKQHRDSLCSTIVAHLGKDGLMFIHPTQNRSLTPREAARIQSFPDWFKFPVARTHQYKLIGNAVPPLVGKAVGVAITLWLRDVIKYANNTSNRIDSQKAISNLKDLIATNGNGKLAQMTAEEFKKGWIAIAYFYNHLHPDSARENGQAVSSDTLSIPKQLEGIDERLLYPVYERSGWPVFLSKFAIEAHKRLEKGELSLSEYYNSDVHVAGYKHHKRSG